MNLSVGLVHHPVLDRAKTVVATNITNFDVHDIARVATVYGLAHYFIIHPSQEQLMFVSRLLEHWRIGDGKKYNPMRSTALEPVRTAASIDEVKRLWSGDDGVPVRVIGTTARKIEGVERISFQSLRTQMKSPQEPACKWLLLFGTGFGMTEDLLKSCDYLLEPLKGAPPLDYRHLSVRSAVSICLDRLLGVW